MKIVNKTDTSISIMDEDRDNLTRCFRSILVDAEGKELGENVDFKKEVEAFAGVGFLDDQKR